MRAHRDVARALKSEVAPLGCTWEKYHKAKTTLLRPHRHDAKINDYFTQAAAAAKQVMDRGVWRIYPPATPTTTTADFPDQRPGQANPRCSGIRNMMATR